MGTNKTASSSLQRLCRESEKVLIDNELAFPLNSNWKQHSGAAWLSQKRDIKGLQGFFKLISEETKAAKCKTTLISGEDFENFLVDTHLANEFELLAKSAGYNDIDWIVVKRKPLDYLLSLYSEMSSYKAALDIELMSKLILEYGFVSIGAETYNWKFVFDINKFSEHFKKNVNKNLRVISFEDFTFDFVGKVVLKDYLDKKSLDLLREVSKKIGILRQRHPPEKVELRYLAHFLGLQPSEKFHEANKDLVDSLVSHRVNRNKNLLVDIEKKFKEKFG